MIVPQTSNVLVLAISGAKSSSSEIMVLLIEGGSFIVGTVDLVYFRFARSWSRWPSAVAMESGRKWVMFRNVFGIGNIWGKVFVLWNHGIVDRGRKFYSGNCWLGGLQVCTLLIKMVGCCCNGSWKETSDVRDVETWPGKEIAILDCTNKSSRSSTKSASMEVLN